MPPPPPPEPERNPRTLVWRLGDPVSVLVPEAPVLGEIAVAVPWIWYHTAKHTVPEPVATSTLPLEPLAKVMRDDHPDGLLYVFVGSVVAVLSLLP